MMNTLKKYCSKIPQRWVFALMCFFGLFYMCAMRACLSLTLTEMVVPSKVEEVYDGSCPSTEESTGEPLFQDASPLRKTYSWSEETQGIILSSFFWIYVIVHVPGGILAQKYGGKHTLGFGALISAIFTLLTPPLIHYGDATGLMIARAFIGLGQGVTFPAISVLMSQWVPTLERSRTASSVYAAQPLGTIFANVASGLIIHHTGAIHNVFYVMGGLSVVWYFLWLFMCYDDPREHPCISDDELNYLEKHVDRQKRDKSMPIPWRHILTSTAVWAAVWGTLGFDWIYLTIVTDLPKFMSTVLKISVKDNGLLNSAVFLSMWFGSIVTSLLADYAIGRQFLSTTKVRKIGSVLTLSCSACFAVAASYVGCDRFLVTTMFILAIGFSGAAFPSVSINVLDLSPNYSGIIMALSNGVATGVGGIVSPYLIGVMTTHQTLVEWRLIFWIMFVVAVTTNLVFLCYGTGEVQEWNDPNFVDFQKKRRMSRNPRSCDSGVKNVKCKSAKSVSVQIC